MALNFILLLVFSVSCALTEAEMTLANVTRLASGDLFSLLGTDCGPTRCMEASHGTALGALGDGCVCRCRRETPAFREDRRMCVNHIDECAMASFGRGSTKPLIPFVFLPLKGQIIYPSKEIVFTGVEDAICAVTSAQYLSTSGWVTLRDLVDNDVPFGLYRDEGSTFLQWRGSPGLHARLEGRLVSVHVVCSSTKSDLATSCAAFRIAGASSNGLLDVRSIPFHAGEIVSTESSGQTGLSVLEALAIGVCVLMLIFIYAAGIIFYVHYKQKQKRKQKEAKNNMSSTSSENGSSLESRIDMSNVMLKTNPLLKFNDMGNDFMNDSGLSDSCNDNTLESSKSGHNNSSKFQNMNSNVVSAMVHSKRKKPSRPSVRQASNSDRLNERLQRRSSSPDAFERAPHSDLSIVDCSSVEHNYGSRDICYEGEPVIRKKLYFNPVFFETEHLKDPPPAAIEFLIKIREVMSIAKDKMVDKRFIPILSDIPEEDRYHTVDFGWDIPCARRGRRFSAISLKQENSRKSVPCGGCPGCGSNGKPKVVALTRSNSCKSCVSDDYKQRIVRQWLDEVPTLPPTILAPKPMKSVAKISGTSRVMEFKSKESRVSIAEPVRNEISKITDNIPKKLATDKNDISKSIIETIVKLNALETKENNKRSKIDSSASEVKVTISNPIMTQPEKTSPSSHASRRIRKKLPPPPPPPPPFKSQAPQPPEFAKKDEVPIPKEVKVKMEAVIKELNNCRRVEPIEIEEMKYEMISPITFAPKIVIPVLAADSFYYSDDNKLTNPRKKKLSEGEESIDFDSLERNNMIRRRRFSLACRPELTYMNDFGNEFRSLVDRDRLTSSWLDMTKTMDDSSSAQRFTHFGSSSVNEIFISSTEPLYDNISKPGPLTIQVTGSPVENRRNLYEDFDPDTLDRKPKQDTKKRVEKILLKSAGSFKQKSSSPEKDAYKEPKEPNFANKIGNLRQIYEMKANAQQEEKQIYKRRGSLQYVGQDLADLMRSLKGPDLLHHVEGQKDKPPVPPKARRGSDASLKFSAPLRESPPDRRRSEERDKFGAYSRAENLHARRSGRRSARTRSRRTDLKKLYRTEDSGYMSTDSNESKRRAKYLLQLRPKTAIHEPNRIQVTRTVNKAPIAIESDTDDLESLCDGRSESGGESVETDSVFFGNFDDSKDMLEELGLNAFEPQNKMTQGHMHEQIDSGFMGETNIILSGDSDSEHRSVISIVTGRDGQPAVKNIEDSPYLHTVEC